MQLNAVRTMTATESAYHHIKNWILSGELEPGSKVNVDELCRALNLSRVPIRGALDKLSSENLVVDIPRRGIIVQHVSVENLNSVFSMRCMLESLAIITAVDVATREDINNIRSLLDDQDHQSNDIDVVMQQNRSFHFALFALTKDDTLIKVLDNLWAQSNRYRRIYYKKTDYKDRVVREHYELLDTIEAQDKQKAIDFLIEHTRKSQEMLLKILDSEIEPQKFNIIAK